MDAQNSWISYENSKTLVCVGGDLIVSFMDSAISCVDTTTKTISTFKTNSLFGSLDCSFAAGHRRLPFLAFVDALLEPTIYIITLPELTNYCTFSSSHVTLYLDIRFSETDLLIALTDRPDYMLRIFNIRTQQLIIEHKTFVPCHPKCLFLQPNPNPSILQFSRIRKEVYVYDLCFQGKEVAVHETSHIYLPKEYENATRKYFAVGDDEIFYVINDRGVMSKIVAGQCTLQVEWSSPYMTDGLPPRDHYLFATRQGMLVVADNRIICIRNKNNNWNIDWVFDNTKIIIDNLLTTFNNEIYIANPESGIYRLDVKDKQCELVTIYDNKFRVADYKMPKGIREEAIIFLTFDHKVQFFDLTNFQIFSNITTASAECIAVHNTWPYMTLGTTDGSVHIYSYDKIVAPVQLGQLNNLNCKIMKLEMLENVIVAVDEDWNFLLIEADFKNCIFLHFATIEKQISERESVLDIIFPDTERIIVFVGKDLANELPSANQMWIFEFKRNKINYRKLVYHLPANYVAFATTTSIYSKKGALELSAVKISSPIIDFYCLEPNGQLILESSMETPHICSIDGLSATKNLVSFSADGVIMHYRVHKKSTKPYSVARRLYIKYRPRQLKNCEDCFNLKYFVYHFHGGLARIDRLTSQPEIILDNIELPVEHIKPIYSKKAEIKKFSTEENLIEIVYTEEELEKPEIIRNKLEQLSIELTELIDYDMSVTGKTAGIFRKFCLNQTWLLMLTEQTRLLLNIERKSLEECTLEQQKIRDWIRSLIMKHSDMIHYKVRALYSNTNFENYAVPRPPKELQQEYDIYRFYDCDQLDSDMLDEEEEPENAPVEEEHTEKRFWKKRFVIEGDSAYEYVMSPDFAIQDINSVTINQFLNDAVKYRMILKDALKLEFNKLFADVQKYKEDMMANIIGTNASLSRAYENMNIMLSLLDMPTFTPPELTVPEWQNDEILERILEVDESEVKAINRRKKKLQEAEVKVGRMLLWSIEFWIRALLTMMDGVLEKLWEEEIKKDIPIPEFMLKKSPHEYTIEDQRLLREYEERVRQLEADRRKYLKILKENEAKILHQKANIILKINQRITEMTIVKLNYDYALAHNILRIVNTNVMQKKRIEMHNTIEDVRKTVDRLNNYSVRYMDLTENWESSLQDHRARLDSAIVKDKQVEKQFRGNFLANAPPHQSNELLKLFKRRPKINLHFLNSSIICFELALALTQKSSRQTIPLPKEANEFLASIDILDEPSNGPAQLESKYWDSFCKLRRLKLESELKVKGMQIQVAEIANVKAWFVKEQNGMKIMKTEQIQQFDETLDAYVENVQNMPLQITLTMGQVEIKTKGALASLKDSVLMHVDDINAVNELINAAGRRKLKAMQRVASFRRQVIYKEWEHKMISANNAYLKYMLSVIEKCKISMEFLQILRKWEKVMENRETMQSLGVLERAVTEKILAFRKNLDRILEKIEYTKHEIELQRANSRRLNRNIDAVKVQVTMTQLERDELLEEKHSFDLKDRMGKIRTHRQLMDTIRRDYAHILELNTILELQRLRTYPTLGPPFPDCPPLKEFSI